MAFSFHWSKEDIMNMTQKERTAWLYQINRIRKEEKALRDNDRQQYFERILAMRAAETDNR